MSSVTLDFNEQETLGDIREPAFLKPGRYHVVVTEVTDIVNDQTQETVGFELKLQVADGTVADQKLKSFKQKYYLPSSSHKDGGVFASKQLKALCLVSGLVSPTATNRAQIDFAQLTDLQFICDVKERKFKDRDGNEGKTIEIAGLNMWHVDEPEVANVPKNPTLIEVHAGHRWTPEMIAKAQSTHGGGATSTAGSAAAGATSHGAAGSKPDYSTL